MEIPDSLRCLFTGEIEERDGSYLVEVPARELDTGQILEDEVYRVAILEEGDTEEDDTVGSATAPQTGADLGAGDIEVGDIYHVEIEDIGDQGDGLARIGEGYVVFVPGTKLGDEVTVEITEARETVAFAEVVS